MPSTVLHTERLDLVPWALDHEQRLRELATIPQLARSIARGRVWHPADVARVASEMEVHWHRHGFGWRALIERSTGIVAGFAGVAHTTDAESALGEDDLEFGCWMHPAYWRRGLGIEASTAVLDEAFARPGVGAIFGCTPDGDTAAADGGAALGFVRDRRVITDRGQTTQVLRLDAAAWSLRRGLLIR